MERMNLREAAARTLRSITTLRRYIRSGRLSAEKSAGRYGPEYTVSTQDLIDAGFNVEPDVPRTTVQALEKIDHPKPVPSKAETVQLHLYQELQWKHEQLLVQYGMVRASGMRVMKLQCELEAREKRMDELSGELRRLRERLVSESRRARKSSHEAELELEGKTIEISALKEKVRALEMLMRNAITSESIDQQVAGVLHQARRVGRHSAGISKPSAKPSWAVEKPNSTTEDH